MLYLSEIVIQLIAFTNLIIISIKTKLIQILILLLHWIIYYSLMKLMGIEIFYFLLFSLTCYIIYAYIAKEVHFKNFYNEKSLGDKKNLQEQLLNNLLPKHLLDNFRNNPNSVVNLIESYSNVTLLSACVAGLYDSSNQLLPEQITNILKEIFEEFDTICLQLNIFKLYLVGDRYLCMGFLDKSSRAEPQDEANNVVQLAFRMMR